MPTWPTPSASRRAPPPPPRQKARAPSRKILVLLRAQTGHDFSQYKPSTVRRRIERRLAVHQIEAVEDYVKYVRQKPAEVEALFRDLLIGVTSFFRDPEAFAALEQEVVPQLFLGKSPGSLIRVWCPGCSTGEEAYSLAILLQEQIEALKQSFRIQVFATDIDSHAIALARAGLYPASIVGDVSPDRLGRFFTTEPGGADGVPGAYRIHKGIRDLLVFSEQNVVRDPPVLETRPDQLPEPDDLSGPGTAEETHPPLPLRPESRRLPLSGHLRDGGRAWRPLRCGRSQAEALPIARRMSAVP